jgi:hypothetical protein
VRVTRRRRYNGGRTRGGSGIGLIPVALMLVFAVVASKYHAGALPILAQIRGFFGQ